MRGERSTRTCRGAHYIGYDKRVDAPWFIVLSAFVSSRIPHQCTCEQRSLGSIDPTSSAPSCESVHATRCTSLRVSRRPCARTDDDYLQLAASDYTARCRVRHSAGRAYGKGLRAGAYAHNVTVATGPTSDAHFNWFRSQCAEKTPASVGRPKCER